MSTRAKAKAKGDLVACAALAVVAAVYLVQAFRLPTGAGNQQDIGPRTYPLLLGFLLVAGIVTLGILALLRLRSAEPESGAEETDVAVDSEAEAGVAPAASAESGRERRIRWAVLAAVVVVTLIYLQLLVTLGFLLATAVFLAVQLLLVGGNPGRYRGIHVLTPIVFGVLGSVAIYLVFDSFLGVLLPDGVLAF